MTTHGNFIAQTPPMGWNSFDCYGSTVTELEVLVNAKYASQELVKHGWEYIVVDFCWSHPYPGSVANPNLEYHFDEYWPLLCMDDYGRLTPAPNRFPSAADGKGFKPLAEDIHRLGLKFGIHVMRGIPRQAVLNQLPIFNTDLNAADVANSDSTCKWLNHMVGVDMTKPGGQAYYDSIFALYAEWGVDYVKVDDLIYPYHEAEIEAIWKAARNCGRPMVVSMSCGPAPLERVEHLRAHSNLWRISADFWDDWEQLKTHLQLCQKWAGESEVGHWADADMLPLGRISLRGPKGLPRQTRFTPDEQRMLMTLCAIMRSPLMFGGNLPDNDDFTLSLMTNDDILYVNQRCLGNHVAFRRNDDQEVGWIASYPYSPGLALALFNLSDSDNPNFIVPVQTLSGQEHWLVRDLWAGLNVGAFDNDFAVSVPAHGARLLRLHPIE